MSSLPKALWLVGHKDASGRDSYVGVFVSLKFARDVFSSLAQTDSSVFLVHVKVQI